MQLFTHLLSSYLQGMGDFFSALPRGAEAPRKCFRHNRKEPPPLGRALKNYRYFHFIGVVRRHYRAFTRRSGYDVW